MWFEFKAALVYIVNNLFSIHLALQMLHNLMGRVDTVFPVQLCSLMCAFPVLICRIFHIIFWKCKCNIFMYISLSLSTSPTSIITGLQLISLQTQTRRNKMLKTKITEKLWSKNGNGKRQLACAHNFPERRTCRKWQLLAFDCFTDDVNDVSTHRVPTSAPPRPESSLWPSDRIISNSSSSENYVQTKRK